MFNFANMNEFALKNGNSLAVGALQGSNSDVLFQPGDVMIIYCYGDFEFTLLRLSFMITDIRRDGTPTTSKLSFSFYLAGGGPPSVISVSVSSNLTGFVMQKK